MKKVFFLFFTIMSLCSFAQENVKLNYSTSTDLARKELHQLVKNDLEVERIVNQITKLEKEGKVILSTKEYAPIKKKILSAPKTPTTDTEFEMKAFAEMASNKYIVITDLIKK